MANLDLHGIFPPITTPFSSGKVAYDKLASNIEKWNRNSAYIEILVDNIFADFPKWLYFSNFFIDLTLSETVFHEIGH